MKLKLFIASSLFAIAGAAQADTLREALQKAYNSNPTLTGARANQRANDENVALARARQMPNANLQASTNQNIDAYPNGQPSRRVQGAIGVEMPIYSAGGFRSQVRSAEARVAAGQANLLLVESDVFVQTVTAYMDVLRDEAIVALNQSEVKLLRVNLEATKDRFEVGDLTKTDVAQSESRLALAESNLETAEARLIGSRERYVEVVGDEPRNLETPPPLPNMPNTVQQAVDIALAGNPNLLAANHAKKSAEFDVRVARSQRMPRVSGVANVQGGHFLGSLDSPIRAERDHSVGVGVQATMPLYSGGANAAQIRQSQARLSESTEQIIAIERSVIAQTRSAYASWRASLAVINSTEVAVKANKLALEGVRAENSVGTRTILDILDAQQELLNSEVRLVEAKRNAYVAGFQLLAVMGRAQYGFLGLDGGALYDPNINYNRVTNIKWDWKNDPDPAPQATRTVDTPPQTPAITPAKGEKK